MSSFSAGNAFEILGGDLTMKNAVTLRSNGDDFRFTQGSQTRLENSLAVRHSFSSGFN